MTQITGQKNQDGLYIWHNYKPRKSFEDRLMGLILGEPPEEDDEDDDDVDF